MMTMLMVIVLGGCAANRMPLESVVSIEQENGTIGGDVYAARRAQGEDVPYQRGSQIVEVRTVYEIDHQNKHRSTSEMEVAGADCLLKGDGFSAKVKTPSGVRVPLYGYRTGELTLECTLGGYKPTISVVQTYNKTTAARESSAASGGLLGVLVVAVINAASDQTNDDYEYIDKPVVLEPLGEDQEPESGSMSASAGNS